MADTMIILRDGFSISYESRNWIVSRTILRNRRDDGEEYEAEEVLGYYSDLAPAARCVLREHVSDLGDQDARSIIAAIEWALERVTKTICERQGEPVA